MALKILFFALLFTLSLESPPTNCKTCYGFFLLFHDFKTDQAKKEYIAKFYSKYKSYLTFPFEYGVYNLIEKDGIKKVIHEFNNCKNKSCIKDFCSKLSGKICNYI